MKAAAALVFLILCAGCVPKEDFAQDEGESPDAAVKAEFSAGEEATAWMIDTKHTLAGLNPAEAHGLIARLVELGVAEMKVADIVPDQADPSYKTAQRLLIKLPRSEKERGEVERFVNEFAGSSYSGQDTDIIAIEFPIKR